jgi:TPR repeat protein
MELFNKSGLGVASLVLLIGSIIACQSKDEMLPSPAQIEATALTARQGNEASAERRVREWAEQGLPVAQRELGFLYKNRLDRRADAIDMFEKAARAGDAEAAFQLGELYRFPARGGTAEPAKAWAWYTMAAEKKHVGAALALAQLPTNADGVTPDPAGSAKWLTVASDLGSARAMFLLHTAYLGGDGVPRDAVRSRQLLEASARHGYPAAVQELSMAAPLGDDLTSGEDSRTPALLKTAISREHDHANLLR